MARHPQEDHADLGLIDDDQTPDMRTARVVPGGCTPGASRSNPTHDQESEVTPW
jgi:hypothetical protein